jgi:subtilase family serine protease
MTVFAASGDSGSDDCHDGQSSKEVDYPASDPMVVGVGQMSGTPTPATTAAKDGAHTILWLGTPAPIAPKRADETSGRSQ